MENRESIEKSQALKYSSNTGEMTILVDQCSKLLNHTITSLSNKEPNAAIKETVSAATSAVGKHVGAKLDTPSIENTKTLAEAEELHALARKANAEADKIELENIEKKMHLMDRILGAGENLNTMKTALGINDKKLEENNGNKNS